MIVAIWREESAEYLLRAGYVECKERIILSEKELRHFNFSKVTVVLILAELGSQYPLENFYGLSLVEKLRWNYHYGGSIILFSFLRRETLFSSRGSLKTLSVSDYCRLPNKISTIDLDLKRSKIICISYFVNRLDRESQNTGHGQFWNALSVGRVKLILAPTESNNEIEALEKYVIPIFHIFNEAISIVILESGEIGHRVAGKLKKILRSWEKSKEDGNYEDFFSKSKYVISKFNDFRDLKKQLER